MDEIPLVTLYGLMWVNTSVPRRDPAIGLPPIFRVFTIGHPTVPLSFNGAPFSLTFKGLGIVPLTSLNE